jgi:diadenylate cyclase
LFTLPQFTWLSLLDILVVAAVIYQFLLLIKGTRASQMLVGIGVIVLALYFARRGQLPVITWFVSNLLPYAVFALIVVFQAEIRHVLAKIGRVITFSGTSTNAESYDDLVMAASLFSQQKTGALIVLEREIGLRTYIESGVPMDAHLSYDLLATIFRPSAPLHDGAVIIRQDRIAAAACFLPLSMNPVLSNQLGTRHRAAIGITEETDAVAVIVSEETGQISFALAGVIERNLTSDQLRQRLSDLMHLYVAHMPVPTPLRDDTEVGSALDKSEEETL